MSATPAFVERQLRRPYVDFALCLLLKRRRMALPTVDPAVLWPGFEEAEVTVGVMPKGDWAAPVNDTITLMKLARVVQPRRILELGSYRGHTAKAFLDNAPDARLTAVDIDAQHGEAYRDGPLAARVDRRVGAIGPDVLGVEERGRYDIVFVDADHRRQAAAHDTDVALEMVSDDGMVLWHDYSNWGWFTGDCGVPEVLNDLAARLPIAHLTGTNIAVHRPAWVGECGPLDAAVEATQAEARQGHWRPPRRAGTASSGPHRRPGAAARRGPGAASRRLAHGAGVARRLGRAPDDAAPQAFPPGAFYSPVPPAAELLREPERARVWPAEPGDPPGIDLRADAQLALLHQLARHRLADLAAGPEPRYDPGNDQFPPQDAALLHALIVHLAPRRVVEVGCGWSTTVTARAIAAAATTGGLATALTCIDPYPRSFVASIPQVTELRTEKVEHTPMATFDALGAGDVLFIDSSHVAKTGSDVVHLVLGVLPRLADGVVVHVHDVFWPQDYPQGWVRAGFGWNEQYLVQAFLAGNGRAHVLALNRWLALRHPDAVVDALGPVALDGSSVWFVVGEEPADGGGSI